ncbi:MAG: response regulator transcription factor [Oscillochloris sp.]|nr:response regulator transcription factor [Oscillochloris sp.]
MQNTTVLIVEDEVPIQNILSSYLRAEGYTVYTAGDGASALAQMWAVRPSLVILDIMLPGMDGFEVCRRIQQDFDVYILFLTARSEEVDKLIGLSIGADDYLTKPFSPRELMARVKTILRRSRTPGPRMVAARPVERPVLRFVQFMIDPASHTVWRSGSAIDLTPREFELLYVLAEHVGRVCNRDQLLERVWGSSFAGIERVVDVHIKQLRRKLEDDPGNPKLIQTLRGVGYRLTATRLE